MSRQGNPKTQQHPAPIIKKKLHAEEEGHHGGVWKIAYADFMTAMMTFFLVMWLINSASKEKIIQIASYFNPVKLSDRTPAVKSVHENSKSGPEEENTPAEKAPKDVGKPSQKPATPPKHEPPPKHEEETLFRNPFGVLTELASHAESAVTAAAAQARQEKLATGGASHDPFVTDPIMSQLVNRPGGAGERQGLASDANAAPPPQKTEASPAQAQKLADAKTEPSAAERQAKDAAEKKDAGEKQVRAETQERAALLEKELGRLLGALPQSLRPAISIKATAEGILVNLTDDTKFSMFRISSAEPSPQLVVFLEKAGGLIGKYPGKIVIRGHTDARPYAGDPHGNWRLSVNRATMTYYMLLRGKVDDNRFLALEGYAERSLKNKANPLAGENRRIEILIRAPES